MIVVGGGVVIVVGPGVVGDLVGESGSVGTSVVSPHDPIPVISIWFSKDSFCFTILPFAQH